MDVWAKMYEKAKAVYNPKDVSPFIVANHVVAAVESDSGEIFTGFCIESASGVMNICAERMAAISMYSKTGETTIKRVMAFRDKPPAIEENMFPCGACREFFMQLSYKNRDTEILLDYETRKTIFLREVLPYWWGDSRYQVRNSMF